MPIQRTELPAHEAILLAGPPSDNKAVMHKVRFAAHDPAIWIGTRDRAILIARDVELPRARAGGSADAVHAYEEFTPPGGLSGDRGIRAAQATAECLARLGITRVHADRSLALVYVHELNERGIAVSLDPTLGIHERRQKDEHEVACLRAVQNATEAVIERALRLIAGAKADADGVLRDPDEPSHPLTSDAVRSRISRWLFDYGCIAEGTIVVCGPQGADCHADGHGELRTSQPILLDVFPRDTRTGYHGDCSRTMVHGDIPDAVAAMHAAVSLAKKNAILACKAGVTGEAVHRAAIDTISASGYTIGFAPENPPAGFCSMMHGTGHGIGLELKEPPLLDFKGPVLLAGDAVTIEPGLYAPEIGGVRIEDLLIVRDGHAENLNTLSEQLDWA
jgi:Xaa-Pro aminopeptidase